MIDFKSFIQNEKKDTSNINVENDCVPKTDEALTPRNKDLKKAYKAGASHKSSPEVVRRAAGYNVGKDKGLSKAFHGGYTSK
jgi:hypothetical protein